MTDLIERLESADETTQYEVMGAVIERLYPQPDPEATDWEERFQVRRVLFDILHEAEERKAPALLLGVAAMMVPESDAGFLTFWRLGNDGEGADPGAFRAEVYQTSADDHRRAVSISAVPACALAAACLKSRSVSEGKSNG